MHLLNVLAVAAGLMTAAPAMSKEEIVYKKVSGVSGNLNSIGSDTLNNLMTYWAESFRKVYPNVKIQVEGKGSSTAPPALISGIAQLGPMSRKMKNKEIEKFEKEHGFPPIKIAVAIDSLAVYVHKDNPIAGMNIQQVDAVFSKTRQHGLKSDIKVWGDLGMTGEWASRPISLYGRNSASGTYGFFKKKALKKGDFKDTVKEQPGSASVVNGVGGDIAGIGYSGIGYKTSEVRAIPLAKKAGQEFVQADFDKAVSGEYPLGRALYIYLVKQPGKPLPKLTLEFLKFVLSKEGQKIVEKDGYGALPHKMLVKQRTKIGAKIAH